MKISAFVNCFNEEIEIPSLMDNLKGVDEIIVIDHESTDRTAKLAKKLGAVVYTQPILTEIVTERDVEYFTKRFGFEPQYKEGDKMWDGATDFNESIKLCSNDWILYIDADERITWDIEEIKKLMKEYDVIKCMFVSKHNGDKSASSSFESKKLFNRKKAWFTCRIHTMIHGYNLKEVFTDKMRIDHWQVEKEYRKEYLARLEYAFFKEQSSRMNYYLARQYFHERMFEKSLYMFDIYLLNATYIPEICKAYTLMSGCLWELKRYEESFNYLFKAMRIYPHDRLPFEMMANLIEITNPQDALIWRTLAKQIEDKGSI